jgi:hypothetical protein
MYAPKIKNIKDKKVCLPNQLEPGKVDVIEEMPGTSKVGWSFV